MASGGAGGGADGFDPSKMPNVRHLTLLGKMPNVSHLLFNLKSQFENLVMRERSGKASRGSTMFAFTKFMETIIAISKDKGYKKVSILQGYFDAFKDVSKTNYDEAVRRMFLIIDSFGKLEIPIPFTSTEIQTIFMNIMSGGSKSTHLEKEQAARYYGLNGGRRTMRRRRHAKKTRKSKRL
jgi:hypothetical protein